MKLIDFFMELLGQVVLWVFPVMVMLVACAFWFILRGRSGSAPSPWLLPCFVLVLIAMGAAGFVIYTEP
jgi:hypothetical protein